ncbi:MAG: hypothetical protein BMS9Abin03_234 [Thermodesulfobacteriota bacterium]|nr:MAG: hypothetical protein BMS9Abin03_234 [Thermodesulfobacteriota bacterium]
MDINRSRPAIVSLFLITICSWLFPLSIHAASRGISVISDLSHQSGKLGAYKALIIGINDYKDPKIPNLETAVNDASAMAKLLREKYGFQIKLLLDRKATREGIYRALRKLASSTKSDDSVLIYYAGHGDLDRTYNDGWWIPTDAKGGNPLTYLDNVQVQKSMRSMNARHVLLISDSCYSGTLFGQSRAIPPVIDNRYYLNLYNEKSRWGMTSGNKTPVSDRGTGGHSVFAYQLLKELKKNEKPYISTQELYTRIAPIIGNNSEQTPICRPILNTGDQGGEFIFVASSSAVIERPSPRPSKALLSIESNVPGARVLMDGRYVGSTNLLNVEVAPGEHRIRVEKDGFEPYTKKIRFEKGRTRDLYVVLDPKAPLKSRIYVDTKPKDARIRILNIGTIFNQGMELDAGRYHIEVSANGYETQKMWVSLTAVQDKTLDFRLKPIAKQQPVASQGQKVTNSLGMEFVYIKPGSFMMGSPSNESGRDSDEKQHRVTLTKEFYMQSTEVTQGQWKAVMGNNPSEFKNCGDDCPVEKVSWNDVQEFIRKLNRREGGNRYRLPTEAEWEYAARAGSTTAFANGGITELKCGFDSNLDAMGWYCGNSNEKTHPIARKQPNSWGLYDMHGNVWEWCQDWYGKYSSSFVTNPTGPSDGSFRVSRGGGWIRNARYCRSALRNRDSPGDRYNAALGFRLLRRAKGPK